MIISFVDIAKKMVCLKLISELNNCRKDCVHIINISVCPSSPEDETWKIEYMVGDDLSINAIKLVFPSDAQIAEYLAYGGGLHEFLELSRIYF